MEITPEIVSFLKEVSLGAASGRLQEKAQALLASIEAAQQAKAAKEYLKGERNVVQIHNLRIRRKHESGYGSR